MKNYQEEAGEKSGNINRPRKKKKFNKQIKILNSYYKYVEEFKRKHEHNEKNRRCRKEQNGTSRSERSKMK